MGRQVRLLVVKYGPLVLALGMGTTAGALPGQMTLTFTELPGNIVLVSGGVRSTMAAEMLSKVLDERYQLVFGKVETLTLPRTAAAPKPEPDPLAANSIEESDDPADAIFAYISKCRNHQYVLSELMEAVLGHALPSQDESGQRSTEYNKFIGRCKAVEQRIARGHPGKSFQAIKGAAKGTRGLLPNKN